MQIYLKEPPKGSFLFKWPFYQGIGKLKYSYFYLYLYKVVL